MNIAPGSVEGASGVVDEIGTGEAEVDDVDTLLEHAPGEGIDQFGARGAHVAGDEHSAGAAEAGESDAERIGHIGVELVGDGAAYVVRLDDLVEHPGVGGGHAASHATGRGQRRRR